jgi:tetratricopeptide (TPR) repeat protein
MRRASTFTSAAFALSAAGLAVTLALRLLPAAGAAPQSPPERPTTAVASQPSIEPTGDALYAQGCARLQAGDPGAAVELLARAVAGSPDKLDYALKLAKAHAAAGQPPAALRLLNDLAARHPHHTACHVALAELHALGGDWPAVEAALSPFEAELQPAESVLLARAYAETKRPGDAELLLRRGLERAPVSETLWLALIDQYLDRDQAGLALQCTRQARSECGLSPPLQLREAQAYYDLGQVLGETHVMRMPNHRAGQFVGEWLLLEKRAEPDRFLCCPRASALYALRQALDAGLDEPAAHCLHARIWQRAGRPEVGLAILKSREPVLLEDASPETLEAFADLALAANALNDFLRYARRRAQREPQRRTDLLFDAYVAAAERYNLRGDEAMYRQLLQRALALRAEDAALMLQLADAVWSAGAREEAAIWYRRVLEREPAHRDRGRILQRLGD